VKEIRSTYWLGSNFTQPAVLRLSALVTISYLPLLTPHGSSGIKHALRIPFLLQLQQSGILDSVEAFLPVRLIDSRLIQVTSTKVAFGRDSAPWAKNIADERIGSLFCLGGGRVFGRGVIDERCANEKGDDVAKGGRNLNVRVRSQ
jgi:hypothetical protein